MVRQISSASASASLPISRRRRLNKGCLSEKTNVAVSEGLKPWRPRDRETSASISRTPDHSSVVMSVVLPC